MENGTEASLIAMHIMVVLAEFSSADLLWSNSFYKYIIFFAISIGKRVNFHILQCSDILNFVQI